MIKIDKDGTGYIVQLIDSGWITDSWAMHMEPTPTRPLAVALVDEIEKLRTENAQLQTALHTANMATIGRFAGEDSDYDPGYDTQWKERDRDDE